MTIKKSKALYLFVLAGCISLAFADLRYNERKALVYHVQPTSESKTLFAEDNPYFNQTKTDDEKDNSFYSMLLPCD